MISDSFIRVIALLCSAIILLSGCSTSVLVKQWSDPSYQGPALTRILVIAIRKDPVRRRVWEDAFIGDLARHGVNAIPSYRLFPDAVPDTNQIADAVAANDLNGIIITRRLPKVVTTVNVEGYVAKEPETKYSQRRGQFYTFYHDVEYPGYVDTQKTANRSIDIWTAGRESWLIWTAVSETPEPATAKDVHRDIVGLVTADLVKHGFVAKVK